MYFSTIVMQSPIVLTGTKMSFSIFLLCLMLLQSNLTEQATEGTTEHTTDVTTYSSTETSSYTEPTTDGTSVNSNSESMSTETDPSTEPTTYQTSYTETMPTLQNTELTTEGNTEDPNTDSTVSTEFTTTAAILTPMRTSSLLPSDVSNGPENKGSNESELQSSETNQSTINVFGIVLASIVGAIAVFYIIQLLIKKYRRKSYIVRSPGMELGRA